MEDLVSEEINKDNAISQQSYKVISENNTENNFLTQMNEKETSEWLKKLNIEEEVLQKLEEIIKNGKDLLSIYNDKKFLEKLNINLHTNNIINDAIEEGLEEQLKINILLEKGKNIFLNIENEPKYRLKDILLYLEKLLGHPVFLTPASSPYEILTPNTRIVKKIILNPKKYCNLKIFDEKTVRSNNKNAFEKQTIEKPENKNKKDISLLKNNKNIMNNLNQDITKDMTNLNQENNNININKNLLNVEQNINNTNNNKLANLSKGYVSLFQNKKNNLPDFTTDYQMPSQNRSNGNNFIKLENKINSNPIEDFKYHNILSLKGKEEKDDKKNIIKDITLTNDDNNDPKNIGFKNISNYKNINLKENDNMNSNNNLNKNYFTQRNFNVKNKSNDNNMMFQQIINKKRSENNISNFMGNLEDKENISMIERNKREIEKDRDRDISINFNNNEMKKQSNNKTENRYEFSRLQDLDKELFTKNNMFIQKSKTIQDNNTNINDLIIKQNEELKNSKDKFELNLKDDSENEVLKALREKYSLENKDISNDSDNNNNRMNFDLKKEYKPKTPINEGRRIIADNVRFTNLTDDNSNNPLENKFLAQQQNDDFMKFNNFPNKNNQMIFNMNKEEDETNNFFNKFKADINLDGNNNKMGKNNNRVNRPSAGLEFNSLQYKVAGYQSSFPQNQEKPLNQYNLNDD